MRLRDHPAQHSPPGRSESSFRPAGAQLSLLGALARQWEMRRGQIPARRQVPGHASLALLARDDESGGGGFRQAVVRPLLW